MPPPYAPAGRCIYCGSTTYSETEPTHKLGDEHLVPRGFGGAVLLPNASCQKHERATSQIEDHCVRHLLRGARPHLKLRGRKSGRVARTAPLGDASGASVPIEAHPGWMIDFTYPYPAFLAGRKPPPGQDDAFTHVRPVVRDFEHRVKRLGGSIHVKLGGPDSLLTFARLLAKIAHVYAIAELGPDSFEPWLPPIILQEEPSQFGIMDLVGTGRLDEPPSKYRHEVSFAHGMTVYGELVVRVRLFGDLHAPSRAHYVVVGKPV